MLTNHTEEGGSSFSIRTPKFLPCFANRPPPCLSQNVQYVYAIEATRIVQINRSVKGRGNRNRIEATRKKGTDFVLHKLNSVALYESNNKGWNPEENILQRRFVESSKVLSRKIFHRK